MCWARSGRTRSEEMGAESGEAWGEERQEAGTSGCRPQAGRLDASAVGDGRGVPTPGLRTEPTTGGLTSEASEESISRAPPSARRPTRDNTNRPVRVTASSRWSERARVADCSTQTVRTPECTELLTQLQESADGSAAERRLVTVEGRKAVPQLTEGGLLMEARGSAAAGVSTSRSEH